jgi:hypothetical protein
MIDARSGLITRPRLLHLDTLGQEEQMAVPYADLARRGQLFLAAMQAPVLFPVGLTTVGSGLTLFNPADALVMLAVLQCTVSMTGTPTAAVQANTVMAYAANVGTPTSAVPIVPVNGLVGGTVAPVGQAYSSCTLPAGLVVVRLHPVSLSHETAVGGQRLSAVDQVDGALCLAPGSLVSLQNLGSAFDAMISICWAELPLRG